MGEWVVGGWVGGWFTGREGSVCCGTVELARALPSESACGIIAVWKLLSSSAPRRLGTHCIVSTSVAVPVACGLGTFGHSRMLLPASPWDWRDRKGACVI